MKKAIFIFVLGLMLKSAFSQCIDSTLINPMAICPMIWMPVCGCNEVTYGNECEATNFGGVTSWTQGECSTVDTLCQTIPSGVDFGLCDMVLGVANTDSGCVLSLVAVPSAVMEWIMPGIFILPHGNV